MIACRKKLRQNKFKKMQLPWRNQFSEKINCQHSILVLYNNINLHTHLCSIHFSSRLKNSTTLIVTDYSSIYLQFHAWTILWKLITFSKLWEFEYMAMSPAINVYFVRKTSQNKNKEPHFVCLFFGWFFFFLLPFECWQTTLLYSGFEMQFSLLAALLYLPRMHECVYSCQCVTQ